MSMEYNRLIYTVGICICSLQEYIPCAVVQVTDIVKLVVTHHTKTENTEHIP